MTAAILTTIRQQLRKRWVRCAGCLCALAVGYIASAGSMIGLAFHPRVAALPFGGEIREATFTLYTPAILISRSRYCPKAFPQFLSWSIGDQRKDVFQYACRVAHRRWKGQQLLSFGVGLYKDHVRCLQPLIHETRSYAEEVYELQQRGNESESSHGHSEDSATTASFLDLRVTPLSDLIGFHSTEIDADYVRERPPTERDLEEPLVALEDRPSSRLGGSLALPGDLNWLPPSVLLTPEDVAGLPSEERDEKSGLCFPTRVFPKRHDPSGPFVFTVLMTR